MAPTSDVVGSAAPGRRRAAPNTDSAPSTASVASACATPSSLAGDGDVSGCVGEDCETGAGLGAEPATEVGVVAVGDAGAGAAGADGSADGAGSGRVAADRCGRSRGSISSLGGYSKDEPARGASNDGAAGVRVG